MTIAITPENARPCRRWHVAKDGERIGTITHSPTGLYWVRIDGRPGRRAITIDRAFDIAFVNAKAA